jgi:signal transduction histidine kinase
VQYTRKVTIGPSAQKLSYLPLLPILRYREQRARQARAKTRGIMDKMIENSSLSDELKEELALFRALKPYIAQCLNLNHELNNVLAGILGYTDFLMDESEGLSEDQKHYVQQISRCAERIQNTLMNLSDQKIELGQKLNLREIAERLGQPDPDHAENPSKD